MSCQPRWPQSSRWAIAWPMSSNARRHERGDGVCRSAAASWGSDGSSAPRRASAGTATAGERTRAAQRYWPVVPPARALAAAAPGAPARPRRQTPPHLLELHPCGHLLGDQCGLDAVEEALQPAHELRLGDAQLAVGGRAVRVERGDDAGQLLAQLRGQGRLELAQRRRVDLLEATAARVVELGGPDLLEQLLDHRADPHDLRRLLDGRRRVLRGLPARPPRAGRARRRGRARCRRGSRRGRRS